MIQAYWNKFKILSLRVVGKFFVILKCVFLDIKNKKNRSLFLLILFLIIFYLWGLSSALLWFLFLSFLFYGWESRIIATMALISLASCPFLLYFKKDALAETMAVYAYFFLVMTVVLQIVELKRETKNDQAKE